MNRGKFALMIILALSLINCGGKENKKTKVAGNVTVGLEVGNKTPELVFNSPDGNPIALSSLKGKMVLVDFWAGWCAPCRRENPNIVEAYNKFKDSKFEIGKGFTIYGISLDNNKEQWLDAIEKDGLIWETHVSELKGWNSEAAQIYQIQGIPANFLINGDGIIVAKNLRGEALHETLKNFKK